MRVARGKTGKDAGLGGLLAPRLPWTLRGGVSPFPSLLAGSTSLRNSSGQNLDGPLDYHSLWTSQTAPSNLIMCYRTRGNAFQVADIIMNVECSFSDFKSNITLHNSRYNPKEVLPEYVGVGMTIKSTSHESLIWA